MGLTIHYTIRFKGGKSLLQKHLKQIRQKCLDMPFKEVGDVTVREITESAWRVFNDLQRWCIFPNNSEENLSKRDKILKDRFGLETWDFIEAQSYYFRNGEIIERMDKPATRVGLSLWPDEGCESSDLNFLKRGNKYICSSFCKTQYAEHFVRSHLLVIALLDMVKEIGGFNVEVHDEGGYWETRDVKVLAKEINASTAMIKSILGDLTEVLNKNGEDIEIEAPISDSENYVKVDGEFPGYEDTAGND